MTGNVTPPPTAYLYVTASTGGAWETTVISNVSRRWRNRRIEVDDAGARRLFRALPDRD